MNGFDGERAARGLAERLADELVESGDITDLRLRDVFARTPRHVFVPHFAVTTNTPRGTRYELRSGSNSEQHDEWLKAVYSNETLLTQVNGQPVEKIFAGGSGFGRHSSSSTAPGLMAWMLGVLALSRGNRVLEIGTGTGYNAALLSERLGAGQVTTIDIDEQLTGLARERLASIGLRPCVVTGDGRAGYPANAPYDRVISTCGLGYIPPAWIEQSEPDGLILANVGGMLGGAMLLAAVEEGNTARGRFLRRWAGFMPSRHAQPNDVGYSKAAISGTTAVSPDVLDDPAFGFLAELHIPRARRYWATDAEGRNITGLKRHDGSWAEVHKAGRDGEQHVRQGGPERLWDRIEEAYGLWEEKGRPDWSRFSFEARPDGQIIALEDRQWRLPVEAIDEASVL
ncbi:methyltransferase domain-containing protein [Thermopolyspora sp. NPDC052614]|uniref:methyltransferase domain-containing protein n=1 Tax=Thermopolyspora sp. NPDC052614 TaxID=3155682 RepID=UPI003414BADE